MAYGQTLGLIYTNVSKAFPGIFASLNIIGLSHEMIVFIRKHQKKFRNKSWHPELILNTTVQS